MLLSAALIILAGLALNHLFEKAGLPGLLGIMLAGAVAGPYALNMISPDLMKVSGEFRLLALAIILLRAGLGISREALNKIGRVILPLAAIPSLMEVAAVALAAPALLGIDPLSALILGAVLAAVSPAVVVPGMLELTARGLGTEKRIPAAILGASSLDNAFVIALFTSAISLHGGEGGGYLAAVGRIPVAIIAGLVIGVVAGYAVYRAFEYFHPRATRMTLALLAIAILLLGLEEALKGIAPISGLLAVLATGFILLETTETRARKIADKLAKMWIFAEILLFTLVGAQVDPSAVGQAGLAGALVILIALAARGLGTLFALTGSGLEIREKLFCVVAFSPKATVQAAIGAVPLSMGLASGGTILAMAAMAIVITAPLGAIGTRAMGERWLAGSAKSAKRF